MEGTEGGVPPSHPWPLNGSVFMTSLYPASFWFRMSLLLWKNESFDMAVPLYLTSVSVSIGGAGVECHHWNNVPFMECSP